MHITSERSSQNARETKARQLIRPKLSRKISSIPWTNKGEPSIIIIPIFFLPVNKKISVNSLLGMTKGFSQNSNHCHMVEISYPVENTLNYTSCFGKSTHKTRVTGIHAATQNCFQKETKVDINIIGKHANLEATV